MNEQSLIINCAECQVRIEAVEKLYGTNVNCPQCGNPMYIPFPEPGDEVIYRNKIGKRIMPVPKSIQNKDNPPASDKKDKPKTSKIMVGLVIVILLFIAFILSAVSYDIVKKGNADSVIYTLFFIVIISFVVTTGSGKNIRAIHWFLVLGCVIFFGFLSMFKSCMPDYSKSINTRQAEKDKQYSWDGSHKKLVARVKGSMKDPSSFTHISTKVIDKNSRTLVYMEYSGVNSFGARVQSCVAAEADPMSGDIISIISE